MRDLIYGWLSISVLLLLKILEVVHQLFFHILVPLHTFPLLIGDVADPVLHSSLNGRAVEKLGVSFSFLQPTDSRFLSPENFLLLVSILQLSLKFKFFGSKKICSSRSDDLLLHVLHLLFQTPLLCKDVAKDIVVPIFDVLLDPLEFLLELEHFGSFRRSESFPDRVNQVRKGGVREPKSFKPERLFEVKAYALPLEHYGPMIRAWDRENRPSDVSAYMNCVVR